MATDRIAERRRIFKQYKEDVESRGKPFYPFAMFHDTVMSLVVVCVITGLAIVWKYSTPGDHIGTDPGWLGKLYDAPADPGTFSFVPRPDWYFYFLFYLLRIFKWPDTVVIGTIGLPTVLLVILIAVPFIDVRPERRLLHRPVAIVASILVVVSMGVLTYKGATAKESLGTELLAKVPSWAKKQGFIEQPKAIAGAKLFAVSGCLNCHTYLGLGGGFAGAPNLTRRGCEEQGHRLPDQASREPGRSEPGLADAVVPGSRQPRTSRKLATFLEASKGGK